MLMTRDEAVDETDDKRFDKIFDSLEDNACVRINIRAGDWIHGGHWHNDESGAREADNIVRMQ